MRRPVERLSRAGLVVVILCAALSIGAPRQPAFAQGAMTIATHKEKSSFHAVGSAFAEVRTRTLGRDVEVKPFPRWTVYLPLIDEGKVTLGFATGVDAGELYATAHGGKRLDKLRAVLRLWPVRYSFLSRNHLGIQSMVGLRGKRVALDMEGIAAFGPINRALLATVGLKEQDVRPVTIRSFTDGTNRMIKGEIDAIPIAVGVPLVKKARKTVPGGVNYVALIGPKANAAFLSNIVPGLYTVVVKPEKRLPEITQNTLVAGFDVYLITSAAVPSNVVTAIVKALHQEFGTLQSNQPVLRAGAQDLVSAPTNPIPYHPGAIAYFKQQDMWTEDNDKAEARLRQ